MTQPYQLSVAQAASQIRDKTLSPVALMQSVLARCAALEPRLNVWVTLDPNGAMEAAVQRESELMRDGPRGPLHGVPVGIKDIYNTKDMRTTCCSPIYADYVPDHDATAVALLKKAGAIIMGKTVTTQFACGDPSPTINPWNALHTPGGSSSGSAVGAATGMFPASLGTQTGGSVLRPAAYNGVVGLKPTFGRISRFGVYPVSWTLDTMGTFTRTVEDAAIMLTVMAGPDIKDEHTSHREALDYTRAIGSQKTPPRIGVLRTFFFERCNDEVRRHTDAVVENLRSAGAIVNDVEIPVDFDTVLAAQRLLMSVEAAAVHEENFRTRADDFAPIVRELIEMGMITPGVAYVQAQRVRKRFRREMEEAIQGFDVLLTPSTPAAAPRSLSTTGDPMFQSPWTTCGLPTITLPSGLNGDGLPLGIQLAGAPFDEERLLAAAKWCEDVLEFTLTPVD